MSIAEISLKRSWSRVIQPIIINLNAITESKSVFVVCKEPTTLTYTVKLTNPPIMIKVTIAYIDSRSSTNKEYLIQQFNNTVTQFNILWTHTHGRSKNISNFMKFEMMTVYQHSNSNKKNGKSNTPTIRRRPRYLYSRRLSRPVHLLSLCLCGRPLGFRVNG